MATYILLMTFTPEGRQQMLDDTHAISRAVAAVQNPQIQTLGTYGVLGDYDFVCIVEAPDNEAMARFSVELGVKAGVHITTLPAVPISRLEGAAPTDAPRASETSSPQPTA